MTEVFWQDDNNKRFPCKDCKDRHLACWQDCERYQAAQQEHQDRKQRLADEKAKERNYTQVRSHRRAQIKRYAEYYDRKGR